MSSNAGDENPNAANPGRGGGSRMGNNTLNNFPDSHQVFVGNLPHHCQESDLEELFSKFGKVIQVFFFDFVLFENHQKKYTYPSLTPSRLYRI